MLRKFRNTLLLAGVLVFVAAATAAAGIRPDTFTLTPQAGVMIFEGNQAFESPGLVGGFALGYNFGSHWGTEGVLLYGSGKRKYSDQSIPITAAHLDLLYHFKEQEGLVPYASVFFGGLRLDTDDDMLAGYGVGLKYFLNEDVALRLDVKHLFDINYRDTEAYKRHEYYNMLAATAGVYFQFGGETAMVPLIKDADADGVHDVYDRCPGTSAGVKVDADGCAVKKEPVKLLDSDRDGVTDNLDLCPDTATGVAVDGKGCPVVTDKDLDGVIDVLDVCPDTPAKTVVDARGCPVQVTLAVALPEPALTFNLEYLPNEVEVRKDFAAEMEKMAEFIKANPGRRFVIEGHTDSVGSDASNMRLSLSRAEKIRDYLVEKMGISASLLEARGFGESNPVADNNTQEGRQQNRRVVIIAFPQ